VTATDTHLAIEAVFRLEQAKLIAGWNLRISPAEFDEVAAELGRTLDFFKIPKREKAEVLAAFTAHKGEVTAGYVENPKRG
jgi:hypothetical protein